MKQIYNLDLTRGLVEYWTFTEADGAARVGVNGTSLTSSGTVLSGAGLIGNAAVLNSTGPLRLTLVSGSAAHLMPAGSFTVAGWINPVTLTANHTYLAKSNNTGNQRGYNFGYGNTNTRYRAICSADGTNNTTLECTDFTPVTGVWTFFSAGYDQAAARLWIRINCGLLFTAAFTGPIFSNTAVFAFGGFGTTANGDPANALVDEWGFWNRTLSDRELRHLMAGTLGRTHPFRQR